MERPLKDVASSVSSSRRWHLLRPLTIYAIKYSIVRSLVPCSVLLIYTICHKFSLTRLIQIPYSTNLSLIGLHYVETWDPAISFVEPSIPDTTQQLREYQQRLNHSNVCSHPNFYRTRTVPFGVIPLHVTFQLCSCMWNDQIWPIQLCSLQLVWVLLLLLKLILCSLIYFVGCSNINYSASIFLGCPDVIITACTISEWFTIWSDPYKKLTRIAFILSLKIICTNMMWFCFWSLWYRKCERGFVYFTTSVGTTDVQVI
jgi:hypothetical protein